MGPRPQGIGLVKNAQLEEISSVSSDRPRLEVIMHAASLAVAAVLAPFAAFGQAPAPYPGPAPSFQVKELPPEPPASAGANFYAPDAAGVLSRVIFETDE